MSKAAPAWLLRGGVMGNAVREFDWSQTSLGPIEAWPAILRSTVALVLNAQHPMSVWWGPTLIQIFNDAYLTSVGVDEHTAVLGRRAREQWPEVWPIIGPQIENVLRCGQPGRHENAPVPSLRDGGIEDPYWTYGYSPVYDASDEIQGVLVVCTETTELRKVASLTTRLRASEVARERAEDANRAKDDFLATASHELRTPLNAILGWARMLRAGTLDTATFQRGLEAVERNAAAQVRLIDDILDGSRVIAGKLGLEKRELDLSRLVAGALEAVRLAAEAKGVTLGVDLYAERAPLLGDAERLQQVVWNLCNNAIKFTPTGGTVSVCLARSATHFELSVADDGQGIDLDFLPHVFDRFKQAEGSTTRRHGGLGLGLALVRHLVEAHDGTVSAESQGPGFGAIFRVWLPAHFSATEAEPLSPPVDHERPSSSGVQLAGLHVLVVDDESDARELLATVLRGSQAEVTLAASAAEALEILAHTLPTILISDVAMPGTDGYQLIRRLRTELGVSAARLPAIALTAYGRAEDRERAVEAGFQAHIVKPVEPFDLLRLVADMFVAP